MKKIRIWPAAAYTWFILWTLMMVLIVRGPDLWASDEGRLAGERNRKEVTVQSGLLFGSEVEYEPDRQYTDEEGNQYELKNWNMVPEVIDARTDRGKAALIYDNCEGKRLIPDVCQTSFLDYVTGQEVLGTCRLEGMTESDERWADDFSFTAVFHGYDSDFFRLGEKEVAFDDEKPPLEGCESEMLNLIGVNPSDYRIIDAVWQGPAYTDDRGVLCRNAVVTGEKKVWKIEADYVGTVTFPQIQGVRCVAVYGQADQAAVLDSSRQEATEPIVIEEDTVSKPSFWDMLRHMVAASIAVLAILLIVALLLWMITKKKRREVHEKKS